jgi:hypothetical protein
MPSFSWSWMLLLRYQLSPTMNMRSSPPAIPAWIPGTDVGSTAKRFCSQLRSVSLYRAVSSHVPGKREGRHSLSGAETANFVVAGGHSVSLGFTGNHPGAFNIPSRSATAPRWTRPPASARTQRPPLTGSDAKREKRLSDTSLNIW